jgi:biotin operon repressor
MGETAEKKSHAASLASSQRLQQTLAILLDFQWHDGAAITGKTGSQALHTDIHELRENGIHIEQRYNGRTEDGRRISQYRLVAPAINKDIQDRQDNGKTSFRF